MNEGDTHKDVKSIGKISEKQHCRDAKSRSITIPIIKSSLDDGFDIGTGFVFKGYAYLKLHITPDLLQPENQGNICGNTGCSTTLADRTWVHKNYSSS